MSGQTAVALRRGPTLQPCASCGGPRTFQNEYGHWECPDCDALTRAMRHARRRARAHRRALYEARRKRAAEEREQQRRRQRADELARDKRIDLPTRTLARHIEMLIEREAARHFWGLAGSNGKPVRPNGSTQAPDQCIEQVCERLGIGPRLFYRWREGGTLTVSFYKALNLLARMNGNWWDVWNRDTVRKPALEVRVYKQRTWSARPGRMRWELHSARAYGDLGPDDAPETEIEAPCTLWGYPAVRRAGMLRYIAQVMEASGESLAALERTRMRARYCWTWNRDVDEPRPWVDPELAGM